MSYVLPIEKPDLTPRLGPYHRELLQQVLQAVVERTPPADRILRLRLELAAVRQGDVATAHRMGTIASSDDEAVAVLIEGLRNRSPAVRAACLQGLTSAGHAAGAGLSDILALIHDRHPTVRAALVELLRSLGGSYGEARMAVLHLVSLGDARALAILDEWGVVGWPEVWKVLQKCLIDCTLHPSIVARHLSTAPESFISGFLKGLPSYIAEDIKQLFAHWRREELERQSRWDD